MLITDLLLTYVSWLFAAVMFIWLGSYLYRTIRNTFAPDWEQTIEGVGVPTPVLVNIPARPIRKPRIPLTPAA
ncbi:hypothetical protein [Arthrobacter sp. UYCo732]|uniref:hypothetical protein n=1 Tax=Arthrobacter sp. UYCo732 TaxID=3156336 RepID=UPI003396C2E7